MRQPHNSAHIVIDMERCKGCYFCIAFCPKNIIGQASYNNQRGDTPVAVIEEKADQCTGCLACAIMCPDMTITVYRRGKTLIQPES
ncbi:ferredoxin family protein [Chloroflexota bacterium]